MDFWSCFISWQTKKFCLTLVRKAKKDSCINLDHKNVTENENFWKSIKSHFSGKSLAKNKIALMEQT